MFTHTYEVGAETVPREMVWVLGEGRHFGPIEHHQGMWWRFPIKEYGWYFRKTLKALSLGKDS